MKIFYSIYFDIASKGFHTSMDGHADEKLDCVMLDML